MIILIKTSIYPKCCEFRC